MSAVETPTFKVCTLCGKRYTRADWDALAILGHPLPYRDDDEVPMQTVMKNCHCGTTLAIEEEIPRARP